ncbi:hypothetical protein [Micromonospora sp. LOL_023]|uniref:hypothetical protein n=1 Tax=Micromonospora sp. LOL_023 TaxID=3345418 RepID=UPI003A89DF3B
MATEDLERALRDCLVDRAGNAPRTADLAGRAIRRARRIRRTRTGGVAVLAGCLLASAGIAGGQLLLSPSATTTALLAEPAPSAGSALTSSGPAAPAAPLPFSGELQREPMAAVQLPPVDIVLAGELRTTEGQRVSLDPLVDVAQAIRMSGGWLVVTEPSTDGDAGVWFVTTDASPKAVLPGVDAVAVDEAGARIAWRRGTEVAVASVVSGELTGTTTSPVPERSSPIGFAGDAVLMARDRADRTRGYSVWRPEQGEFQPIWSDTTSAVYGTLPDGSTVVAQISDASGRPCLALLDVRHDFTVTRTACMLPLTGDGRGAVSADGRWLMINGVADARSASESELALLVDLQRVFDGQAGAVREAGQRITGTTVWVDPATVVHASGLDQVVRIDVDRISNDRGGAVEQLKLPVSTSSDTQPVLVAGVTDRR